LLEKCCPRQKKEDENEQSKPLSVQRDSTEVSVQTHLKQHHLDVEKAQRQLAESWRLKAEKHSDETALVISMDYCTKFPIPRQLVKTKIGATSQLKKLNIHLANYHVFHQSIGGRKYFIHPEMFPESGNSIVTALWFVLLQPQYFQFKSLQLIFDGHSTNRCNTLLFFFILV